MLLIKVDFLTTLLFTFKSYNYKQKIYYLKRI